MSLRALRREIFSRRWNLRGIFSKFNFKRLHSSSPPRRKQGVVEIDLPEASATLPSTLCAEEGGNHEKPVGYFPGASLSPECEGLVEGPCGQVGGGSKLSMMPQVNGMRAGRHGVRHVGITVSFSFECPAMCREICLGWYTVVARFFSAFNCSRIPASSTLIKSWRRRFSEIASRECS